MEINTSHTYNESAFEDLITDTNLRKLARYLDYYFVPCVICAGLVGNTISFVVFAFTNLKKLSSSVYLAALAISDSGFLICVFFSWSNNINIKLYHRPGWCQLFVYMTYLFGFLSVWYIVAFSCERFIAVKWPFKRTEICTPKKAKIVVFVLAIIAGIAYSFAAWTSDVSEWYGAPACMPQAKYKYMVEKINNIDTVITLIIPFITILVCNCGIIYSVRNFTMNCQHWQFNNLGGRPRSCNSNFSRSSASERLEEAGRRHSSVRSRDLSRKAPSRTMSRDRDRSSSHAHIPQTESRHNQLHVTKMLLVVSTIFLLLNLPSHVIRMYDFFTRISDKTYTTTLTVIRLQKIFTYVYYVNFSINFLLYSLCGKNFRKALKGLAKKLKPRLLKRCSRERRLGCSPVSKKTSINSVVTTKV